MGSDCSHRATSSGGFARQAAATAAAERKLTATALALNTPGQVADADAEPVFLEAWEPWLAALKGLAPARATTIADLAEKTRLTAQAIHHVFGPSTGSELARTPHGRLALRLMQALASDAQAVAASTPPLLPASAARKAGRSYPSAPTARGKA